MWNHEEFGKALPRRIRLLAGRAALCYKEDARNNAQSLTFQLLDGYWGLLKYIFQSLAILSK